MEKLLTVITPTYNRAYILENCYNSLKKQTNKSFVWTIIDDGSTDNTKEIVLEWINEQEMEINYIKKSNGGKASALNVAFENLNTQYWVVLDSDDYFADNAIGNALNSLKKIENESTLCGVIALNHYTNGDIMGGERIPSDVTTVTTLELRNQYNLNTEYTQFYKTEHTNPYRYPEIKGEKFISPEYFADLLNEKYEFYVSQETYCYCEYLDDGLTKNKNKVIRENPKGYTLIMKNRYERTDNFKDKSLWGLKYVSGSILSDYKYKETITNTSDTLLTRFLYPFGWLVYKVRFR